VELAVFTEHSVIFYADLFVMFQGGEGLVVLLPHPDTALGKFSIVNFFIFFLSCFFFSGEWVPSIVNFLLYLWCFCHEFYSQTRH
jgi:hypothetical protein